MFRFAKKLWRHLVDEHSAPHKLALAVGLGLFIGTLPVFGLHLGICIAAALIFRLNKLTIYLAANISNPFVAPFLIAGSIVIGEFVRFGTWRSLDVQQGQEFLQQVAIWSWRVPDLFVSCMVGAVFLGAVLAVIGGSLTYLWAAWRLRVHPPTEDGDEAVGDMKIEHVDAAVIEPEPSGEPAAPSEPGVQP